MYSYAVDSPRQLLITVHWGSYEKSEFFDALLTAVGTLPASERLDFRYILCDWRSVTSATLYDTDTAFHYLAYRKLRQLYRMEPDAFKLHMRSVRMAYVLDEGNEVSKTLHERVRRATNIASPTKQPGTQFYSLNEALTYLGFGQQHHAEVASKLQRVRRVVPD